MDVTLSVHGSVPVAVDPDSDPPVPPWAAHSKIKFKLYRTQSGCTDRLDLGPDMDHSVDSRPGLVGPAGFSWHHGARGIDSPPASTAPPSWRTPGRGVTGHQLGLRAVRLPSRLAESAGPAGSSTAGSHERAPVGRAGRHRHCSAGAPSLMCPSSAASGY